MIIVEVAVEVVVVAREGMMVEVVREDKVGMSKGHPVGAVVDKVKDVDEGEIVVAAVAAAGVVILHLRVVQEVDRWVLLLRVV